MLGNLASKSNNDSNYRTSQPSLLETPQSGKRQFTLLLRGSPLSIIDSGTLSAQRKHKPTNRFSVSCSEAEPRPLSRHRPAVWHHNKATLRCSPSSLSPASPCTARF